MIEVQRVADDGTVLNEWRPSSVPTGSATYQAIHHLLADSAIEVIVVREGERFHYRRMQ